MRLRFIWVGKTRNEHLRALQGDYLDRLKHFARCDVVEIRDVRDANPSESEGKRILDKLNQTSFACLLDVGGQPLSSIKLAERVETWQSATRKDISFIIGGAVGVSAAVAARADFRLSLSFLTFTHEMTRVILLEQLYRAYMITSGFPYQK